MKILYYSHFFKPETGATSVCNGSCKHFKYCKLDIL